MADHWSGVSRCLWIAAAPIFLTACAHTPQLWTRADGKDITQNQLMADQAACRGDTERANLSAGDNAQIGSRMFGYSGSLETVYEGCMASRGYLPLDK